MIYSRVKLCETTYPQMQNGWELETSPSYSVIESIYSKYCAYKNFDSVMPIFESELCDPKNDVICYYDGPQIVAFSLLRRYDRHNVEAIQFAWDYTRPSLRLGYRSLVHECAYYRDRGFSYLYLGEADEYKTSLQGFEIIGNRYVG